MTLLGIKTIGTAVHNARPGPSTSVITKCGPLREMSHPDRLKHPFLVLMGLAAVHELVKEHEIY